MTRILSELRRRNVLRVGAAYLVAGWLVLQVVSVLQGALNLPDWVDGFFVLLLAVGFVIALLVAWAFELTPEGLQRTSDAPPSGQPASLGRRVADAVIVSSLAGIAVLMVVTLLRPAGPEAGSVSAGAAPDTVSVAVLPFADMSPDGDQEYFADGISEEILNVLVRVDGLSVAGRTSSFAYKGRNEDLRQIGAELGVSHILEGSVRRFGERLRITAQLIRSNDGFHVWSETYDRFADDIFDIQDEIAGSVTRALTHSLGLAATAHVERPRDLETYDTYLRAKDLYFRRGQDNLETAALLLHTVTARDPDYAPAWTALAGVYAVRRFYIPDIAAERASDYLNFAMAAARRAEELEPDSAEALLWIGFLSAETGDIVAGYEAIDRALELAPDNADILDQAAQSYLFAGYDARELTRRSVALAPRVAMNHNTRGWALAQARRPEDGREAEAAFARARELDPTLSYGYGNALVTLFEQQRFDEAEVLLQAARQHAALPADLLDQFDTLVAAVRDPDHGLWANAGDIPGAIQLYAGLARQDLDIVLAAFDVAPDEPLPFGLDPFLWTDMPYRQDPRWRDFVSRLGLPELWHARGFPPGCRAVGETDFACD
ncbi:tetratricopeptide repeat protein [Maricaulis sp. CAU 1757]